MSMSRETGMPDGALTPSERARLRAKIQERGGNKALSELIGLPAAYISHLQAGEAGASLQRWRLICQKLEVSLSWLFDAEVQPSEPQSPLESLRIIEAQARMLREKFQEAVANGETMPSVGTTVDELIAATKEGTPDKVSRGKSVRSSQDMPAEPREPQHPAAGRRRDIRRR